MVRIITVNLNGIRSAQRKGFFEWVVTENPDIVCVQETKAQMKELNGEAYRPEGYFSYFSDADKKGYSGVGIYCKREPLKVMSRLDNPIADQEGRFIQADYENLSVISLYMPSGTSGEHRQAIKYEFLEFYIKILDKICKGTKPFVICGDWNIAHRNIDLKNWRANQKRTGFLPEERAWLDKVFTEIGLIDAFREVNKEADQYTWWSTRGRAYEKNVGWRIDYQVITPTLKNKIAKVSIYKDQRFSDHAPLIIDYDINLTTV